MISTLGAICKLMLFFSLGATYIANTIQNCENKKRKIQNQIAKSLFWKSLKIGKRVGPKPPSNTPSRVYYKTPEPYLVLEGCFSSAHNVEMLPPTWGDESPWDWIHGMNHGMNMDEMDEWMMYDDADAAATATSSSSSSSPSPPPPPPSINWL